eukprot:TRINITY_DN2760_c0_g2_i6.p1 TRINITY_DN2760_c0_g2~~TRINITY_DN2760_c0_g2_i6.p1  ORF type:complete len:350 (-),score=66.69 TRINITY_DN2760_c0_g2_i6:248-1297(-)
MCIRDRYQRRVRGRDLLMAMLHSTDSGIRPAKRPRSPSSEVASRSQSRQSRHLRCLSHPRTQEHPTQPKNSCTGEAPERNRWVTEALAKDSSLTVTFECPELSCCQELLLSVHGEDMLEALTEQKDDPRKLCNNFLWGGQPSLSAATAAVSICCAAVDIVSGAGDTVHLFCNLRPPGHHSGDPDTDPRYRPVEGGCVFNNAVCAASWWLQKHPDSNVLIVDFDVHHGDGTDCLIENNPRIKLLCVGIHSLYPRQPACDGCFKLPVRTKQGLERPEECLARAKFEEILSKLEQGVAAAGAPELVIFSAGFDAHEVAIVMNGLIVSRRTGQLCTEVDMHTGTGCRARIMKS